MEVKRSCRCLCTMEEHLNSCLHFQINEGSYLSFIVGDGVLFTKEVKTQRKETVPPAS